MQDLVRILVIIVFSLSVSGSSASPIARQSHDSKSQAGSISGRVTLNGKPVKGVPVILTRGAFDDEGKPIGSATTDLDGQFHIANVPAGGCNVSAFAPAFTFDEHGLFSQEGRRITISPGENIEGIEVRLKRGGVITGKVTDSAGRPVVEELVMPTMIDEQGKQRGFDGFSGQTLRTDDRGIYRIFGVPEGRYIVSAGEPPKQFSGSTVRGNVFYPMTFHPGVTDESKATVIEVAAGAESTGVNIVLGSTEKTYSARGRIIDAETGKPVPNLLYGYGILYDGRGISMSACCASADPQGGFRLERLAPNHYGAFVVKDNDAGYYSDIASFDITDADVTELEIKARRGATVSGVAVIEGLPTGDTAAKLTALSIRAFVRSTELAAPSFGSQLQIAADGAFRITGLRAGKVRLSVGADPAHRGFVLTRVEHDGVESPDASFDIAAGEQVTGVRATIVYGVGVIRGQVKISSDLPSGRAGFRVRLKRIGVDFGRPDWSTEADDRNRFLFEDLPPGDYELTVVGYIDSPGSPTAKLPDVTRRVTVANDREAEVTIVIDPAAKGN